MATEVYCKTYESRWERGMFKAARDAVKRSVGIGNRQFKKNIGLTCHSLEDLANMNPPHPYAKKWGPQGIPIHNPYWLVHKQSGNLKRSSVANPLVVETKDSVTGNFGFRPDPVPLMIVGGTSRMIPRPVAAGTLTSLKKEIMDIITDSFKRRYKENMGVTF